MGKEKTQILKSDVLLAVAEIADQEFWNFNRQIDTDKLRSLPPEEYAVMGAYYHHWRMGEPAKRHVRLAVLSTVRQGASLTVDMPEDFFHRHFPDIEIVGQLDEPAPADWQPPEHKPMCIDDILLS